MDKKIYTKEELDDKYIEHINSCFVSKKPSMSFRDFKEFLENDDLVKVPKEFVDAGDVEEKVKPSKEWVRMGSVIKGDITALMRDVNFDVLKERVRQNEKWGHQRHSNGAWLAIAIEEIGEAAQAMMKDTPAAKKTDADNLYSELIQASAVLNAWAEQVKEQMDAE